MRIRRPVAALLLALLVTRPALALPIVDGTRDAEYGTAKAVQTVQTQFADSTGGTSAGSEWNAAYATCDSGRLTLMLTGNLEANFNTVEIFIDSKAGGQSVFDSSGNDSTSAMDGFVFDAGFTADYHLFVRRGTNVGDTFDLEFADLGAQSASSYLDFLTGGGLEGTGSTGTGVNASSINVGFSNANAAGVTGGTGAADTAAAEAVTTGLEISIAFSDLGYVSGPLRVLVGQNNSQHNYWSNQFLGGLPPPQINLGGDGLGGFTGEGAIDLTAFGGDQFFVACNLAAPGSAVPVPATTPLGLALLLLLLATGAVFVTRRERDR